MLIRGINKYEPAQIVTNLTLAQVVGRMHSVLRQRAFWKVTLWDGTEIGEWQGEVRHERELEQVEEQILAVHREMRKLDPNDPTELGALRHLVEYEATLHRQRNSIGLVDWSRLPHERVRQAMLIAPNGHHARFVRPEGGLFFQFKMASLDMCEGSSTDAHVLGAVHGLDGQAEMAVYDGAGLRLERGNVNDLRVGTTPIPMLVGPHLGLTKGLEST